MEYPRNAAEEVRALAAGRVPGWFQRNIGVAGVAGQIKLLETKALVLGLGGLGGHVTEQLARLGAGGITGVDPDVFDESNLNRQILSCRENLGVPKAQVAEERVRHINPALSFRGYRMTHNDIPEPLWAETDIVFDCLDNVPDRLHVADVCSAQDKVLIHGAIAGWYGQAAVVKPHGNLLHRIYPDELDTVHTLEQECGTPAFTAALVAGFMVSLGMKVILGEAFEANTVYYFDLLESSASTVEFD